MMLVSGPLVGSGWFCCTSTQSPTRRFSTRTVGRCCGGGVITVVRGGGKAALVVVSVAVVELVTDGDDSEPLLVTNQITSAISASTMITYDRVSPINARSRPRSPRWRICDSATWPSAAPAGANTNANTIDKVANVLASPCGVPAGGKFGGGKPGPVEAWVIGGV